jgi:Na+/H+ antiporter NhaC
LTYGHHLKLQLIPVAGLYEIFNDTFITENTVSLVIPGQMCIDNAANFRAVLKEVISLGIKSSTTERVNLNDIL